MSLSLESINKTGKILVSAQLLSHIIVMTILSQIVVTFWSFSEDLCGENGCPLYDIFGIKFVGWADTSGWVRSGLFFSRVHKISR